MQLVSSLTDVDVRMLLKSTVLKLENRHFLVLFVVARCHGSLGRLNATEPSIMFLVTPVLLPPPRVKTSAVKKTAITGRTPRAEEEIQSKALEQLLLDLVMRVFCQQS